MHACMYVCMYIFQKQPIELISPPKSFGRAVQRNYPTSYSNLLLEFPKGLQKYQVKLCNLHFKNRICEPNHVAMKPIFQRLPQAIFAPRLIVEDGGAIHILGEVLKLAQDSRHRRKISNVRRAVVPYLVQFSASF